MDDEGSQPTDVRPAAPPPSPGPRPGHWRHRLRHGLAELLIVFVGVYAAFLLNRIDSDRRDAKRRLQILGSLEREVSSNANGLRQDLADTDAQLAAFDRQLANGETPFLAVIYTNSAYSATDDATLLQAGGLDLLDVQTIEELRGVNALQRTLQAGTHNQFELSLATLTNHKPEDFYDAATHQLRREYRWYPHVLHNALADAKAVLTSEESLLAHLRAELHPGRTAPIPAPSPAGRTTP